LTQNRDRNRKFRMQLKKKQTESREELCRRKKKNGGKISSYPEVTPRVARNLHKRIKKRGCAVLETLVEEFPPSKNLFKKSAINSILSETLNKASYIARQCGRYGQEIKKHDTQRRKETILRKKRKTGGGTSALSL